MVLLRKLRLRLDKFYDDFRYFLFVNLGFDYEDDYCITCHKPNDTLGTDEEGLHCYDCKVAGLEALADCREDR
jgi:hypothetical protein